MQGIRNYVVKVSVSAGDESFLSELKRKASIADAVDVRQRRRSEHFALLKGVEHFDAAVYLITREIEKRFEEFSDDPDFVLLQEALKKVKEDKDVSALVIESMPFSNKANSAIIAAMVAREFEARSRDLVITDSVIPQGLHNDHYDNPEIMPVTLLSGEDVSGEHNMVTAFVKVNSVFSLLSDEAKEILQEPIFSFYSEEERTRSHRSLVSPLFYFNELGAICSKIAEGDDIHVTCDDEIKKAKALRALNEIKAVMKEIEYEDIVNIKQNDVVILNNTTYLHGRKKANDVPKTLLEAALGEDKTDKAGGFFGTILKSLYGEPVARHILATVFASSVKVADLSSPSADVADPSGEEVLKRDKSLVK